MRRSVLSLMALSLLAGACSDDKQEPTNLPPEETTDVDTDTDSDTEPGTDVPVDTDTDTDTETDTEVPTGPDANDPVNQEDPAGFKTFGRSLEANVERVSYEDLVAHPERYAVEEEVYSISNMIETVATVKASCQTRGCWMELRPSNSRDPKKVITVRFRNYGFFVPMDSPGSTTRLQGVFLREHLTASEVAHYESEGATYPFKNEDGSADVYEFRANGVRMWR